MENQPGFYTRELLKCLTKNHDDSYRNSLLQGVIIKEQDTISPKIFANASIITTSNHQRKKEIKIFEHLLALVVKPLVNSKEIKIQQCKNIKKHLKKTQNREIKKQLSIIKNFKCVNITSQKRSRIWYIKKKIGL